MVFLRRLGEYEMTEFLVRHFVKDYENTSKVSVRTAYGVLASGVGIFCNVLLTIAKMVIGILLHSVSVTADAFNNLSDAASSIITLVGFDIAGKPADEDHPFGHGRMEYVSGLVVSILILMMGFELFKTSVEKVIHPEVITEQWISYVILAISIALKFWMYLFNKGIGWRIHSETMKATAADSLNDCISTAAVVGGMLVFHYFHLNIDGIVGIFVACFVLWGGYESIKDTLNPLLGESPDPELIAKITETVLNHKMVIGVHDIVVHDYGPGRRIVSLHAEVPYNKDMMEVHDLMDHIEMRLMEEYHCEATIHMDPVVTDDEEVNETRKEVFNIVKKYDKTLSVHDFRMVKGPTHTNVIFDLVVPYGKEYDPERIVKDIKEEIKNEMVGKYYAVIRIDRF